MRPRVNNYLFAAPSHHTDIAAIGDTLNRISERLADIARRLIQNVFHGFCAKVGSSNSKVTQGRKTPSAHFSATRRAVSGVASSAMAFLVFSLTKVSRAFAHSPVNACLATARNRSNSCRSTIVRLGQLATYRKACHHAQAPCAVPVRAVGRDQGCPRTPVAQAHRPFGQQSSALAARHFCRRYSSQSR